MRLRTDSAHIAGWKRAHAILGCHCSPEMIRASRLPREERGRSPAHIAHEPEYEGVEPAQPGDVWRVKAGPLSETIGYALTCPNEQCISGVHIWTHARDCTAKNDPSHGSCWAWTGSPEDGTLSATPSLWAQCDGSGWHGFLTNGEMRSV